MFTECSLNAGHLGWGDENLLFFLLLISIGLRVASLLNVH
jgi:hypothetical protein